MTRAQHHLGGVGSGAAVKLAINTMIAVTNESISELLVLCERAGLDRPTVYGALADSALASPFVQYKQAAFLAPDEAPVSFTPRLMLKDLALAQTLADAVGAELPAVEAARSVLERTVAAGHGDGDLVRVADTLRGRAP
jgi:3-hydroxyisobutyrate dehydrogenase